MAATRHIHFSATVQDSAGIKQTTTVQLFVDTAQTVAQIETALNAWIAALTAITEGKVLRQLFAVSSPVSTSQAGKPVALSEVEECAEFAFNQAALTTHYTNVVPAFPASKLTGNQINLADTDVAAYTTLLTTAPVLGGSYVGLGNEALISLYRAFQGDRTHRRAEFAASVTYP
jgi:hypothetical protein